MLGLENELSHEQKILEEINRQRLVLLTLERQPQWAASDPNQKARTHMMLSLLAKKSTESIHSAGKESERTQSGARAIEAYSDSLQKTLQEERSEQTRLTKERRRASVDGGKTQPRTRLANDDA